MQVPVYLPWLALLCSLAGGADAIFVKQKNNKNLQPEKPGEFVNETEKAVEEVNHLRLISDTMNKFLANNSLEAGMFCEGNGGSCKAMVDRFLARCKSGDCYTVDSVQVFSVPGKFDVKLPHLAQLEMVKHVFKKSGARNSVWSRFTDLFKSNENKHPRSMAAFSSELLKRNLSKMVFNDVNNYMVLNEVLYSTTLYYQRYLNSDTGMSATHNRSAFTRAFFRLKHRGKLNKLVKDLVKDNTLGVSHSDLKSCVDSFVLYLTVGNYRPRHKLALTFGKLVKHALAKAMGYRKVSFLMADYLLKYPVDPNHYCKANAEVGCKDHLLGYLSRCDEGDCTSFDRVDLLDAKDWLNVKLPVLPQVSVAYDLFNSSEAKAPNWFKKLFLNRWNRMSNTQFKDMLYERNVSTVSFKTKNQGYMHRFLAGAALDFVFRAKGAWVGKGVTNSRDSLNSFLSSVTTGDKVVVAVPRARNLVLQYRNYLYKSGMGVDLDKVNKFAKDAQLVLFSHLEDPYKGQYSTKYEKEWEELKKKELEKEEKEKEALEAAKKKAAEKAKKEAEELEESEAEAPEEKKTIKNLWGLIKTTKKEAVTEEQQEQVDELARLKQELDDTRAKFEAFKAGQTNL